MKRVLLVGCGNIGFRHLQAISDVQTALEVVVVEPNLDLHDRIEGQFAAAADSPHRFELSTRLPAESKPWDLVVVATTAAQRRRIVDQVLGRYDVSVLILEKVLFQTSEDLDEVGAMLERRGVHAYVNCGRRTFDGYRELRHQLETPIDVSVHGRRLGLASNMVHFLDLAEFLNDAAIVSLDGSGLVPGSVAGKRPGEIEIFGMVHARLDNGAALHLESLDLDPMRVEVVLSGGRRVVKIDELARTRVEGSLVGPFASQNVSETVEIYADAVETGHCSLTPYRDSVRQHRYFLSMLRRHLDLPDDAPCPVS